MADEKIVTSIVANSDFSGLIADVQRVTNSLHKLQQEFAGSNRALAGQIDAANAMFNQTMLKTGQFSSHFVSLTSDVEKFGRNLDSGRLKLRDYFRVYQDHMRTSGGLIRELAQQQVQLQNAVLQPLGRNAQGLMQYNVHIPRGLDLTKNKSAILRQELAIMNKVIQDGGVQLINWGKNTQWAGRQLTVGLTLPLVAFGKAAADAFKVADQELTRLTKVYGDVAGTSAQELGRVRKEVAQTAKELSASMGVNFAETIGLAADIAATGKTGNELLSSISETTRLSVLGEVDRQEAMKATLAIQSAFKQNTEELAESINFLNAVENQTSTTLNDLVEAIPKAGPVIRGLGGSVEDLALYLTAMREGGINASEGANALKSALASLINPTDVAVKKFQGFGIDLLGIVQKNAGSTTDTLFALQSALDRLDPLSKQQAIEQLFGKFQYSRLNALFENLGRQGSQTLQVLDLMKASASELESVANRELAAVTESAAGRYKRAVESLKASLAGVGDDFLNIATKLVNVLNKIVEFGQRLPDPIKKIMAFGGAFTAIIGPVIMLTGVLANFFGYIIKGLGHFKALFKGAEGFKLLTPEIIAARNASSLLGDEFYSDAKAADTLRLAIERLNNDLAGLQVNATNATRASSGLGQVLATSAGIPIMPMGSMGGPRVAIPEHPLIGGYSRAAAHLNPRDPNDPSTIFGLTLQPIPLNRKIGRTPQIIMSERLPDIEGVTSVGGMSTGVVAGEHARYAALMATLGMQSRQEIEALKKTIGLGGQVSTEFIATFDDILPMTQRLTANAAAQSAAIVADLRAGKITAQQALAAIVAANAELERMMGVEITAYATSRGRSIDLTKAPLIDQPVVDVAGKPNTRGMYRTGIFADVMAAVGRATKTKTYGGPYSIETTRRLNKGGNVTGYSGGGDVFYNNGDQVPGPNINADVVPAMLTPGEFVIRRGIAQQDPDGMRALNEGRAVVVPVVNANKGGEIPGYRLGNFVRAATASRTRDIAITGRLGSHSWQARNAATGAQIDDYLMSIPDPIERMRAAAVIENFAGTITTGRSGVLGRARYAGVIQPGHISREEVGLSAILQANGLPPMTLKLRTHQTHLTRSSLPIGGGQRYVSRYVADYDWLSNLQAKTGKLKVGNFISRNIGRKNKYNTLFEQAGIPEEKWSFVENQVDEALAQMLAGKEEQFIGDNYGDLIFERDFVPVIDQVMINNGGSPSQITAMKRNTVVRGSGKSSPFGKEFRRIFNLNRGGMVPGYNGGGGVSRATLLARLGGKFKYTGKSYEGKDALQVYRFNAMDVDGGRKYFGHIEGLSDKARGALYASTLEFFNTSMIKGDRVGGKRMFMPRSFLTAMPTIAANALTWNKDIMTPEDILILEGIKGKGATLGGSVGSSMALSKVYKDVFRANRGGMVPGYAGGGPAQYGYARGVQRRFLGGGILRMLAAMGVMQAGTQFGQRVGGGAGAAISTASSMLPFMFMGMPGGGNAFRTAPTIAQRLGRTTEFTTNLGAFGTPLSAANPLVTANAVQQISPLKQSIFAQGTPVLGKAAGGVERLATSTNALSRGLGKVLLGATRFNVALGLVTGAVIFGIKKWNEYKEGLERTRLASGLTEESAGKLGLKFKNLSSEIKATLDTYNLWTASNKAAYQGMTAANAPFRMTIADYKKLRKEVKGTMQDQIDLINNTDKADLSRLAIQLKAMFMSAGMSAEEASKKIYMAFALSNKAAQAAQSTVGNVGFNEITDSASAAKAAVETFNHVVGQTFDKEARANAFQTAWLGIVNAIEDATRKAEENAQKNGENFDEQQVRLDEQNKLLSELSKLKLEPIGQRALDQLAAADVSILKLANSLDTVVSLQQKLSLLKDFGFAGNLANYSPEATAKLYAQADAIRQQVEQKNRETALKGEYAELKVLKDKATTLENAAKGEKVRVQINRRERIKALQEEIKKINESADARKKALQEEAEDQDTNLEIQKKRLEYQQMLAAGDFGGAAQAQLDLQQLTNRQQRTLTEREIDARREADIKPLQKEIDSLNDAAQKMADNAAIASESLDKLNKKIKDQQDKIDGFNKAASSYILNQQNNTGKLKDISAGLVDIGTKLGISKDKLDEYVKSLQTTILDNYTGKLGKAVNTIPTPAAEDVSRYRKLLRNTPGDPLTGTPGAALVFNKNTGRWQVVKGYENVNLVSKENTVSYQQWESGYKKYSAGGPIQHFGPGGDVNGPGTATSDSIPAMLSNGEYVVRADAVKHYGVGTFDALNAKRFKDGGEVKKQNWFQRYVSKLTAQQDQLPAWARDPFGMGQLLRKFAGQGRKGDNPALAAALLPLNFMGFGLGRTAATTAAKGASNISNLSAYEKSFAINQIDNEALKSVMNTSLDDILKALPQDERKLIFASLGNARGSASFLKNLGLKTMAENYPKYDFNDPLSFVKNEQPSSILQALREVELLKQSSELRSAWSELLKESEKKVKDYSFMLGKPDKYGDPITESMLIARGAKTTEPEFVSLYNKEYAKLFYGIKNDPEIGIFKGGYSDPSATSSGGWKTSQGQLGTFFSTNPYVAKMFSEAIGGGPENMFSATMPLSKLPTALHSPFDSYNAEWTQFLTPIVLKDLIESGNLSKYPFRNFLKDAESTVGKANGGYIQKFKDGGKIKPIFGTPDPTQGFFNKFLFGTKYVGGPSPVIKGEVPFGPGGVSKLASNSKWIQDELLFDVYRGIKGTLDKTRGLGMHWTTGASIGKGFAGRDTGTIIKGRVPMSSIETNKEALWQGGVFNPNSAAAWVRKLAEKEKEIPVASGAHMLIDAITKIRRVKDPNFIPKPGEYINPFSTIGTMLKSRTRKYKNPKIMQAAGGGYVNPAYFSDMSMPSYFTGAKYVYNDTIAQLHKGEMVVPSGQNPNNPFAMDSTGGPININNNLTINATPGMDTDELVNKVFTKVEQATSLALAKTGRRRAI